MKALKPLFFSLMLTPLCSLAAATSFNDQLAYQLTESLTTEVGPRLAGSPGDRASVAWATKNLQALGLTKSGPKTLSHHIGSAVRHGWKFCRRFHKP